ncbi:MAG: dihydropyrimidinase [Anaerolineae bacterium]
MARILIQGGTIVSSQGASRADILIEDEQIVRVAPVIEQGPGDEVIDAAGLLVLPGIIDAHTHIKLDTGIYRTADNWVVGTRAAAAGGVTTVIDFATQFPGQRFDQAVDQRLAETEGAIIDYALHCMVTDLPIGSEDALRTLIDRGLPSFKIYTTYRPNYYMDDAAILRLMRKTAEIGGLVHVHAENDAIVSEATQHLVQTGRTGWAYHAAGRPPEATQEAVNRIVFLGRLTGCPVYIVHCTTALEIELIAQARAAGQPVWGETCPQYLLLDTGVYQGDHPEHYILQPPLRAPGEPEKLWETVSAGKVSVIATDSCDYTLEQKREYPEFTRTPGGLPGIETLLPLIYTYGVEAGRITPGDMVRLLCENPALLFGIADRKGYLKPGCHADVVLYDPSPERTIHHGDLHYLAGYNPFEGMRVKGAVRMTISRGEIVYRDGEFPAREGRGQFVPGRPLTPDLIELLIG